MCWVVRAFFKFITAVGRGGIGKLKGIIGRSRRRVIRLTSIRPGPRRRPRSRRRHRRPRHRPRHRIASCFSAAAAAAAEMLSTLKPQPLCIIEREIQS